MKKKILLLSVSILLLLTGCFKRDNMDDITIYTTTYPIEFLIKSIYGYNSKIDSIYPLGVDIKTHEFTDKKIKEYSKTNMFIYNGLTEEKQIAAKLINKNSNIKIIDVTKGLTINRDEEELWLCPSNYLMLAQNIKNELLNYITSTIVKQEIINNYDALSLAISKYDVELKNIADNATNKNIIVGNDVFEFLEKYGFNVISVEDNETFLQSDYMEAKNNITNKSNEYIFILDTDTEDENTLAMVKEGAKIIRVNSAISLTEEENNNNYNYNNMMNDFIEQLKMEVYS